MERGGSSCLRMKPPALRSAKKPGAAAKENEEREEWQEQRVRGRVFGEKNPEGGWGCWGCWGRTRSTEGSERIVEFKTTWWGERGAGRERRGIQSSDRMIEG